MQNYRADIDGLRGIAILAVLFHHADAAAVPGGFVGVDVFFVISGFVIAKAIQRTAAAGPFDFLHFYARRVKRLLPAASLMATTTLCVGWLLFLPLDFRELGATLAASAVMLANVQFWRMEDYFAGQERLWPLLHTWSLSVEEQFYLFFPALAVVLFRRPACIRIFVVGSLILLSFAISAWQVSAHPRSAYYLLPSRSWEMLAGSLVAMLPGASNAGAATAAVGCIAAAGIVAPIWLYTHASPFPGVFALAPVVGTMAMIWVASHEQSPFRRILAWRPLVALGIVSYSLYLWHWPLLIFARYLWSAMPDAYPRYMPYVAIAISAIIAVISYRYVESPSRSSSWTDHRVIVVGALVSLAVGSAGAAINILDGVPQRLRPQTLKLANAARDINARRQETMMLPVDRILTGEVAHIGSAADDATPCFALWGDSHGDVLVPVFERMAQARGISAVCFCRAGTLPVGMIQHVHPTGFPVDHEFADAVMDRLERHPVPYVCIAARWTGYIQQRISMGGRVAATETEKASMIRDALAATIRRLKAAGTRHIWLVRECPVQPFNVPRQLALASILGTSGGAATTRERHQKNTHVVNSILDACADERVTVLDPAQCLMERSSPLLDDDGYPTYYDDNHLSVRGAFSVADAFRSMFDEVAKGCTP